MEEVRHGGGGRPGAAMNRWPRTVIHGPWGVAYEGSMVELCDQFIVLMMAVVFFCVFLLLCFLFAVDQRQLVRTGGLLTIIYDY